VCFITEAASVVRLVSDIYTNYSQQSFVRIQISMPTQQHNPPRTKVFTCCDLEGQDRQRLHSGASGTVSGLVSLIAKAKDVGAP
jgi:hypothetical protein